jgi:hypothetical protein
MNTNLLILPFMVSSYADAVYKYGTFRLTERDGYPGVVATYREPVKQYAAENYTEVQIDNALSKGWITQQEYDETMELKSN